MRDELAVKVYHCHTPIPAAELPAGAVASLGTSLESGKDGKKKFTATQPATVRVRVPLPETAFSTCTVTAVEPDLYCHRC